MLTRNILLPGGGLQCVSSTNAIKRKDANEGREHVEDVVQAADPSVGGGQC